MRKLIEKFETPSSSRFKKTSFLLDHKQEAFDVLRKIRNPNSHDWWTRKIAADALNAHFLNRKSISSKMTFDFLKDIGVDNALVRKLLYECLALAAIRHAAALKRQHDLIKVNGGEQSVVRDALKKFEAALPAPRRTFYLAEFNLGLAEGFPEYPRTIVSVTSGLECSSPGSEKSTWYRLAGLGSQTREPFMPNWGGRGDVNVFTNSWRLSPRWLGRIKGLTYLEEADPIFDAVAQRAGRTAILPFSVGWRL